MERRETEGARFKYWGGTIAFGEVLEAVVKSERTLERNSIREASDSGQRENPSSLIPGIID